MKKLFALLFGTTPQPAPVVVVDNRPLYKELYTQSLNNVRHLRASINTYNSVVNYIKGDSPAETRTKRQNVQYRIDWFKKKLTEELGMVEYYAKVMQ